MDAQAQVPVVKLAKVGQKKNKKDKLLPFLPDFLSGSSTPWGAGTGLSLAAKMAIIVAVSTLGVGAYQVGKTLKPGGAAGQAGANGLANIFAKPHYGSVSGLPTNKPWYQNSLGMANAVGGLLGGGNADNSAANGAAGAGANAAANAAGAAGKAGAAGAASPFDALAKAKALAAAKAKAQAAGQGAGAASGLGNGMGGMGSDLGGPSSVAGGSSMEGLPGGLSGGGNGAAGPKTKGAGPGKVAAFTGGGRGLQSLSGPGGGSGEGLCGQGDAKCELNKMGKGTSYGSSGNAQYAKGGSGQGFDTGQSNGSSLAGTGITGGSGNAPAPSSDGGIGGGGPTNGGTQGGNPPVTNPVAPPVAGTTAAPWAGIVKYAGMLLLLAGIILGLETLFAEMNWSFFTAGVVKFLSWVAAALAGIATLMGLMMIGMGQKGQGTLITVLGAITTAGAVYIALNPGYYEYTQLATDQAVTVFSEQMIIAMGSSLSGIVGGALG